MDANAFDGLSRSVSRLLSRRALTVALGIAALGGWEAVGAKKKGKKGKKRKKKGNNGGNAPPPQVVFNEFGCVNVGNFCQNSGQCCSGICTGAVCQAHNEETCQAGNVDCSGAGNPDGLCTTTTGNAGYCLGDLECFNCSKDADCVAFCSNPEAACIICATCAATNNRACAGPVPESCNP
jgi:hypothetical protein